MDIIDQLKYTKISYSKYVKLCNESLRLSLDKNYSNEVKCELLQLLHDATVMTNYEEEDQALEELRKKIKARIGEISPINNDKIIK